MRPNGVLQLMLGRPLPVMDPKVLLDLLRQLVANQMIGTQLPTLGPLRHQPVQQQRPRQILGQRVPIRPTTGERKLTLSPQIPGEAKRLLDLVDQEQEMIGDLVEVLLAAIHEVGVHLMQIEQHRLLLLEMTGVFLAIPQTPAQPLLTTGTHGTLLPIHRHQKRLLPGLEVVVEMIGEPKQMLGQLLKEDQLLDRPKLTTEEVPQVAVVVLGQLELTPLQEVVPAEEEAEESAFAIK